MSPYSTLDRFRHLIKHLLLLYFLPREGAERAAAERGLAARAMQPSRA